jgi:hypothetical protein
MLASNIDSISRWPVEILKYPDRERGRGKNEALEKPESGFLATTDCCRHAWFIAVLPNWLKR